MRVYSTHTACDEMAQDMKKRLGMGGARETKLSWGDNLRLALPTSRVVQESRRKSVSSYQIESRLMI